MMQKFIRLIHNTQRFYTYLSQTGLLWPVLILFLALLTGIFTFWDIDSRIRPVIAFSFMIVCPGMAFVKMLGIDDKLYEWTLAIALSLALDTIIAGAIIYSGVWLPKLALGVLIFLCLVGLFLQLRLKFKTPSMIKGSPS